MSPEDRRLHEGIIRGLIQMIRAWQDWLKAKSGVAQQHDPK